MWRQRASLLANDAAPAAVSPGLLGHGACAWTVTGSTSAPSGQPATGLPICAACPGCPAPEAPAHGWGSQMAVAARVLVLAGGQGPGLWPLTAHRASSAVPFGANFFRLVDLVLSNLVNTGYRRICVLTQYKSHSLARHITTTWRLNQMLENFVIPVPAQQRLGPRWYTGSADTILQSFNVVFDDEPRPSLPHQLPLSNRQRVRSLGAFTINGPRINLAGPGPDRPRGPRRARCRPRIAAGSPVHRWPRRPHIGHAARSATRPHRGWWHE